MKLKFYWYLSDAYKDGILRPACSCIEIKKASDEFIANYLMDDGGQIYWESISWMSEILEKISLIETTKVGVDNLTREVWGADFSIDVVRIYSLYDEGNVQIIALSDMKKVLQEWKKFLRSMPATETYKEINLGCGAED